MALVDTCLQICVELQVRSVIEHENYKTLITAFVHRIPIRCSSNYNVRARRRPFDAVIHEIMRKMRYRRENLS